MDERSWFKVVPGRRSVSLSSDLSQGASALNIGFVISGIDLTKAVERLHGEFFSDLDPEVFSA